WNHTRLHTVPLSHSRPPPARTIAQPGKGARQLAHAGATPPENLGATRAPHARRGTIATIVPRSSQETRDIGPPVEPTDPGRLALSLGRGAGMNAPWMRSPPAADAFRRCSTSPSSGRSAGAVFGRTSPTRPRR